MLIGPARAPDEGSASTGQPACCASRSSAAGSAQPSPQMTTPRSVHGRSRTPGAGAAGKAVHGPPSGRPSSGSGQPPLRAARRVRHAGHQGLTQRQVEVDRPGEPVPGTPGGRPRPAGQRPPVAVHPRPRLGHPGLAEPAHRVPVQLDLVDGLVRAGAAQFRRPVRGEHQQRHPCLAGLDHGPVEVRRRGPRGAHQRDRTAARLGQAEREKRGGPLVDPHMQAQCGPGGDPPDPPLGRRPGGPYGPWPGAGSIPARGPRVPWPAVRCGIPVPARLRPART